MHLTIAQVSLIIYSLKLLHTFRKLYSVNILMNKKKEFETEDKKNSKLLNDP